MTQQFDITKHEWSGNVETLAANEKCITVQVINNIGSPNCAHVQIFKDNAIAIAKHFHDQLSTHERLEFINAIRGVKDLVITSGAMEIGNTYQSLNLGESIYGPVKAIDHEWVNNDG